MPIAYLDMQPVPGLTPVDGWTLHTLPEQDGDGFETPAYVAVSGERQVHLDTSRFRFTPSQDRFAWFVRNGFPPRPSFGPWDDTDIEFRMATDRAPA